MTQTNAQLLTALADAALPNSTNRSLLRDLVANLAAQGIPVVADNAARAIAVPSPVGNERVFNQSTGVVERYDVTVSAWVNAGAPAQALVAYDDFERADQIGLGTAKTGQAWSLTGTGVANLQIQSGRYTMGSGSGAPATGYASIKLASAPVRYGAKFSFAAGGGVGVNPLAIISSSDATFTIQNMLHIIISPVSYTPTVWVGGASHAVAMISAQTTIFASPLATDGTVYECWITVVGNTAHIELPDGTSCDISDPSLAASSGSLLTYEHTYGSTSTAITRFESIAAYGASAQTLAGPLSVPTGIQGPIGNKVMAAGFFTGIGVNTQSPAGQVHVVTTSALGTPPDAFLASSTSTYCSIRVKTTAGGYEPRIWLDEGQTNPVKLYSAGNANDFRIMNNTTDRLIMPLSTTTAIQFPLNPLEIVGAALAASTGSRLVMGGTQQATVGANGAASALTANPLGYIIGYVGAAKVAIPYYNG